MKFHYIATSIWVLTGTFAFESLYFKDITAAVTSLVGKSSQVVLLPPRETVTVYQEVPLEAEVHIKLKKVGVLLADHPILPLSSQTSQRLTDGKACSPTWSLNPSGTLTVTLCQSTVTSYWTADKTSVVKSGNDPASITIILPSRPPISAFIPAYPSLDGTLLPNPSPHKTNASTNVITFKNSDISTTSTLCFSTCSGVQSSSSYRSINITQSATNKSEPSKVLDKSTSFVNDTNNTVNEPGFTVWSVTSIIELCGNNTDECTVFTTETSSITEYASASTKHSKGCALHGEIPFYFFVLTFGALIF